MEKPTIHLGYVIGSGAEIAVPLGHMAVTGQTQLSGKTTTLEALASRSGRKVIVSIGSPTRTASMTGMRWSPSRTSTIRGSSPSAERSFSGSQ